MAAARTPSCVYSRASHVEEPHDPQFRPAPQYHRRGPRVEGNNNLIKTTIENTSLALTCMRATAASSAATTSPQGHAAGTEGDSIGSGTAISAAWRQLHPRHPRFCCLFPDNTISGNRITARLWRALHVAHHNNVEKNDIADCVVGLFLMYSNDLTITGNKLLRSWGASGMGIGMKESSGVVAANNEIMGNAVGIFLDLSPYDPDATNQFERNQVAYNGTGVEFSADWESNVFRNNSFNTNFTQIAVRAAASATRERGAELLDVHG